MEGTVAGGIREPSHLAAFISYREGIAALILQVEKLRPKQVKQPVQIGAWNQVFRMPTAPTTSPKN